MCMKTFKNLAFLSWSAILILSCEEVQTDGGDPPVIAPEVIAIPKNIIPLQEAEDMYHRYGSERVPLIETSVNINADGDLIPKEDPAYIQATRSLSIDYAALTQYLKFIEQQAGKAKTDISGLRIYFSQYPNGKNDSRSTVFLNPIMEAGEKGDIRDDVAFAIKTVGKKSTAVPVGKLIKVPLENSNRADLTMPIQDGIQSLAGNNLPWNPPPKSDPDDFQ